MTMPACFVVVRVWWTARFHPTQILLYKSLRLALLCTLFAAQTTIAETANPAIIAFGSCLKQWEPQIFWDGISRLKPEVFIFTGDNIYSDAWNYKLLPEPERIAVAYDDLARNKKFRNFLNQAQANNTQIFAVWDDHDYGKNDAGAEYKYKLAAKKYFLDFFNLKQTATGDASRPGIYRSQSFILHGINIHLILLDTRSFRSKLTRTKPTKKCKAVNFLPNNDDKSTILGNDQWLWLQRELKKPADIRIIVSSIQVLPEEHCFEKWANFPKERERLLNLLDKNNSSFTLIISGDRHLGEISKLQLSNLKSPLYEITASGFNSALGENSKAKHEKNQHRVGGNILVNHFGTIELYKTMERINLKLQIRDENGVVLKAVEVD